MYDFIPKAVCGACGNGGGLGSHYGAVATHQVRPLPWIGGCGRWFDRVIEGVVGGCGRVVEHW